MSCDKNIIHIQYEKSVQQYKKNIEKWRKNETTGSMT